MSCWTVVSLSFLSCEHLHQASHDMAASLIMGREREREREREKQEGDGEENTAGPGVIACCNLIWEVVTIFYVQDR